MVVFSNRRLGAGVELPVSETVAAGILRATAAAAQPLADARWEHELTRWLEDRARDFSEGSARSVNQYFDVGDIAWTPDHFERQRRFLVHAIVRAEASPAHAVGLDHFRRLVEAHPAESVQVGRRWNWQPTA